MNLVVVAVETSGVWSEEGRRLIYAIRRKLFENLEKAKLRRPQPTNK